MISLAFGRYILEPFFIQCEIPELAIKLITAVGISKYHGYAYIKENNPTKMISDQMSSNFLYGRTAPHIVFFLLIASSQVCVGK